MFASTDTSYDCLQFSAGFLLSYKGSAAERIWSFWWLDNTLWRLGPSSTSHSVKLCTKYEVLSDCPKADGVLEGIPSRKFLVDVLLCWLTVDEGIILVVLQTVNISQYWPDSLYQISNLWNEAGWLSEPTLR